MAPPANVGKYVGRVLTEWLPDGRRMKLLATIRFFDPSNVEWIAPEGSVVDGASIPKAAWTFIGGPFEGKYRNASVIHDVGCEEKKRPWEAVHEVFYWAMLAAGVSKWKAKVMYMAVYYGGPRWSREVMIRNLNKDQESVALEKALATAGPGSTASLMRKEPAGGLLEGIGMDSEEVNYVVQVEPPYSELTESEFEEFKQIIQEKEMLEGFGEFTLEDIRQLKAVDPPE